jgi:hypothetical protein
MQLRLSNLGYHGGLSTKAALWRLSLKAKPVMQLPTLCFKPYEDSRRVAIRDW